ncbi:hypothetical protein M422DRAFT_35851 [Sphaerobolus stellatus SS14]|uniref:Synembryn-A n=1 Tax=Sphaerobolus stellatus (strain SS14) TaxID=990650 RepID=A0A0C9UCB8_SPHS4|nr:hypothetical protein M422DRAFT_35851 [Sphaerobolus stellatus SS14]
MSSPIATYVALTHSSPRDDVKAALQRLIITPVDKLSVKDREELAQAILDDVKDTKGRLSQKEIPTALLALKVIGRNITCSRVIVKRQNFEILWGLATATREQDAEAALEAMRCIANALLLIDTSRDTLLELRGGEGCVEMLERSTNPQTIFLASRILFLLTVEQRPFIRKLVEELRVVDIVAQKCDTLLSSLLAGQPMAKEAMVDLLKFTFNLLLQYPRLVDDNKGKGKEGESSFKGMMGELWSDRLENLLPPLLRLFNELPPTSPCPLAAPLTHVIHSLITIPVSSRWFSPYSSPTSTPRSFPGDKLHRAVSALTTGRRSHSSSRSSSPAPPSSVPRDTVQRAWDLFEVTTAHYVPDDPDDASVRELCKTEGIALDDTLSPLVVLLTRLATGDSTARIRMKDWILPADIDRTSPLEHRKDLLGRCLRLMSSVYFARVKSTVGELLFTICDSDPALLAGQVGYGNCAGFLFNKGIMAPPAGVSDAEGNIINPITGIRNTDKPNPVDEMTEEEKEREAEKLFVLFDRLERQGMGVNPIRKAMQEGKLEEIS